MHRYNLVYAAGISGGLTVTLFAGLPLALLVWRRISIRSGLRIKLPSAGIWPGVVLLGVAAYFQDFLHVSAFTLGNDFGLPTNYWTHIGNVEVQRLTADSVPYMRAINQLTSRMAAPVSVQGA